MNILIITGHPAQIHNFRLIKKELENRGHKIFWLATRKDISNYLLDYYRIEYSSLLKPSKTLISKFKVLIKNTNKCIRYIKKNNIDIILSRLSPYGAVAGFLKRKVHITLLDTETSGIYDKIFCRFVTILLTAKSYKKTLRRNQLRYDSNIELFYLHPKRFKPENVSKILGISHGSKYVLIRFVAWEAYHDKGIQGITYENKIKAVDEFSKYCKIYISSEKCLPDKLKPFTIDIAPERMHDVLKAAKLFFGESGTMASEAAVLGTPAIFLDKFGRGYTDEEEEYGLVYNFGLSIDDQEKAINKGVELLKDNKLKQKTSISRTQFLQKKIDVTAFLVWFIENYPTSAQIMKENPDYQYRFK